MIRYIRRFSLSLLFVGALYVGWILLFSRPSGYAPSSSDSSVTVYVVNHGYHAGLLVPRQTLFSLTQENASYLALRHVAVRFSGVDWLEFGWGDEKFYRFVPELSLSTLPFAAKAVLGLHDSSVLHVVGISDADLKRLPPSRLFPITLSLTRFAEMLMVIERTFRLHNGQPLPLGEGNYGVSLFYAAKGHYHLFNVCNQWVADVLAHGGLPVTSSIAFHPRILLWEISLRQHKY